MKKFGFFVVAVLVVLALAGSVFASDGRVWERTTPTVVVGFGAGGGTDTAVRPLIALMQQYLGETINVINMPGAASAIAAEHVMSLPRDGYTMFATGSGTLGGFLINETSAQGVPWNWYGFHHVRGPAAILVNPERSGIYTIEDAINALKDGTANVGVSSLGAGIHAFVEAFAKAAGIETEINYVTFGGDGATCVALIAGEVEIGSISFQAGIDYVRAGHLRALFLNQTEPMLIGDVTVIPPITDLGPAFYSIPGLAETWPVMIPRDAPAEIVERLTAAFLWACEQPEMKALAERMGFQIIAAHGEEADRMLDFKYAAYAWVLYDAGMAQNSPAQFDIPRPEDWDWETRRALYGF